MQSQHLEERAKTASDTTANRLAQYERLFRLNLHSMVGVKCSDMVILCSNACMHIVNTFFFCETQARNKYVLLLLLMVYTKFFLGFEKKNV